MPDSKQVLLAAYGRLLKPLVRILLRNNVSFGEFSGVLKRTFVDESRNSWAAEEVRTEATRIAIATGLTEDDVTQTLNDDSEKEAASNLGAITKLLSAWHSDSDFTGPYGLPLELSKGKRDDARSFPELVERYSPGISPEVLLSELISVGAVREIDDWLRVLTRTYLPEVDAPEGLERLGQAIQYFVETIDFNRCQDSPVDKLFERIVYADDGIRPEDLGRFKTYVRERAQLLTEDIDNWLSQLEKPDREKGDSAINTGLGIYHYVERKKDSAR